MSKSRGRLLPIERERYEYCADPVLKGEITRGAQQDAALILALDDALIALTKRHDDMCSNWQVKEQEFITKREADCLAKIAQAEARLSERNEATKVWIQADLQTREYCNKLEKRLGIL